MAPPEISDSDIEKVAKSLPTWANQKRLGLLPLVLREWFRADLQGHLS